MRAGDVEIAVSNPRLRGIRLFDLNGLAAPLCHRIFEAHAEPWERARRDRFRSAGDWQRYTQAHAGLRLVLGSLTDVPITGIAIDRSATGRPLLAGGPAFSLSYAGARAILAVASAGNIGLDLLDLRGRHWPLDSSVVSAEDRRAVAGIQGLRHPVDLLAWGAKEAAAKLAGDVGRDPSGWSVAADGRILQVSCGGAHPVAVVEFVPLDPDRIAVLARNCADAGMQAQETAWAS